MQKIALVLSAGGARGIAQAGAIAELERQGFEITSVAGSSIGSVIGGLYAMNRLQEYIDWLASFQKRDVFSLMDFTFSKKGLIRGEKVFRQMQTIIPDMPIEDMRIPYVALATDLFAQKPVVFNRGSFYKAIRASIAIPNVIVPVQKDDTILVDGGILNPLPLQFVKRNEGDILVAVNLYHNSLTEKLKNSGINLDAEEQEEKTEEEKSYMVQFNQRLKQFYSKISDYIPKGEKNSAGHFTLLDMASTAMLHRMAELSLQIYQPEIVINIPSNIAGTFDFHKTRFLLEYGAEKARKAIEKYKKKTENV